MATSNSKGRAKSPEPAVIQPLTLACVRIRPMLAHEQAEEVEIPWVWKEDKLFKREQEGTPLFEGGQVFGPDATTEAFFQRSVLPAVQAAFRGTTATVLAYGEASSGKSHSLMGSKESSGKSHSLMGSKESAGIIWRAVSSLFEMIAASGERATLTITYCEIYNEVISDLLDPRGVRLNLAEDMSFGVRVDGAAERDIRSADEAMFHIKGAEDHRKFVTFRTDPDRIARSTSVLRVHLRKPSGVSSLFIVDLESSGQRGQAVAAASRSRGGALPPKDEDKKAMAVKRMMAKKNTGGLFTLRTVVSMLSERGEKSRNVGPPPQYRDSKLTRLLKNAFDGTGHVVVLCAMSPSVSSEEESIRTLFFACCVAKIRGPSTGKTSLPKAFFEAKEEDLTYMRPLFKLENAAEALWHEVSPLPRLCRLSEYLPVSVAMILDLLLQHEHEMNNLLTELAELKRTLPPLPDGSEISRPASSESGEGALPPRERVSANFRQNFPSSSNANGDGVKRLTSSPSFKVRGSGVDSPQPRRLASSASFRGAPRDPLGRTTSSSTAPAPRQVKTMWVRAKSIWRRLRDCRDKLEEAKKARKSWKAAEEELAMDDLDFERASVDRKGKPWRQSPQMMAARKRVIKSGGRRALRALEKYNGAKMHNNFQKKVDSLEDTLKSVRERLAAVAKIKSNAEKLEELAKMEREIEEKRSAAIENARQAQSEAMYTLNLVLEEGEDSIKAKHVEASEEEGDEDDDEDEDGAEGEGTSETGDDATDKGSGGKGVGFRARKNAKAAAVSDEDFGFLSEEERKDSAAQEERNEDDGMQTILAAIWDGQIESVEALVLGALVDIEAISKEVIASQREGTFESPALQWPAPEISVSETLSLLCMGDNRFGQVGAGQTGPDGSVPRKASQKLFKGGYPLQVDNSWRNTMIVTNHNEIVQIGITDMTLGSGEKPPRGTEVSKSQIVYPVVSGLASHRIMAVSCGWQHSLLISQAGVVFTWGFGGYGALGHGNKYNYDTPTLVESLLGQLVASTAAGSYTSFAVTTSGAVFSWGWGQGGQLGHGTTDIHLLPSKVDKDTNNLHLPPIQKASCGHEHAFLLCKAGNLYAAGLGKNGRLGFPCITEELSFKRVSHAANDEELTWIQDVACGFAHTAILDNSRKVLTCGQGDSGALGHGQPLADETLFRPVKELPAVSLLSCGGFFTACACATEDGQVVWTFGRNEYLQLGRGSYKAAEAKIAVSRLKKMNSVRVGMESVLPQAVPQQLEDGIPSPAVLPNQKDIRNGAIVRMSAGHTHLSLIVAVPASSNGSASRTSSRPSSAERLHREDSERISERPPSAEGGRRVARREGELAPVRNARSRSVSPEPLADPAARQPRGRRSSRSPEPSPGLFPTSTRRDRLPSMDRSALEPAPLFPSPDADRSLPGGPANLSPSSSAFLPAVAGKGFPAPSPTLRPLATNHAPLSPALGSAPRPFTALRGLSNAPSPGGPARMTVPEALQAGRRPSLRPVTLVLEPPSPAAPRRDSRPVNVLLETQAQAQSTPAPRQLSRQGTLSRLRPLPLPALRPPSRAGLEPGT